MDFLAPLRVFISMAKVGLVGFGGGNSMIFLLEQEVVHVRRWMTVEQFKEIIAYSFAAPGLSAGKIAAYAGWLHGGVLGMLAGVIGIWLPGMLMMFALLFLLQRFEQTSWYPRVRDGVLFAAAGLIGASVTSALPHLDRAGGTAALVRYGLGLTIALAVFVVLIRFRQLSPLVVVAAGGLLGLLLL